MNGETVVRMEAVDGRVEATISDGDMVTADHVILATGYKIDVQRLAMILPSMRAEIKTTKVFQS